MVEKYIIQNLILKQSEIPILNDKLNDVKEFYAKE